MSQTKTKDGNERIVAVDLFRGLVVVSYFIAVNTGPGLPWWMYHGYVTNHPQLTWVDLVWPAFLWITGVSIPFAMTRRIERGASAWNILGHILWRFAVLVWIGVLLVPVGEVRFDLMPISKNWYFLLGFLSLVGAFARWDAFRVEGCFRRDRVIRAVQIVSVAYLIFATLVVRYGSQGHTILTAGGNGQTWGVPYSIIGSFGAAFLWMGTLWWLTRKALAVRIGLLGLCLLAIMNSKGGGILTQLIPAQFTYISIVDQKGFIVLAGTIVGDLLLMQRANGVNLRQCLSGLGIGLLAAAFLADPALGWSLQEGTLRYGLLCSGVFTLGFWFVWELGKRMKFPLEKPLMALGSNALLAYFMGLPFLALQGMIGISVRKDLWGGMEGWPGLVDPLAWTVVFTLCVMAANRKKMFLKI
jgi:predicted acyltransferase